MRRSRWWSTCAVACAVAFSGGAVASDAGAAHADAPWKLVGESNGVTVSTRRVVGSTYPEVRASASVCASLPALVDFIEDAAGFDRWIPDTIEARMLERPSTREQIFYIRTGMPWPVKS